MGGGALALIGSGGDIRVPVASPSAEGCNRTRRPGVTCEAGAGFGTFAASLETSKGFMGGGRGSVVVSVRMCGKMTGPSESEEEGEEGTTGYPKLSSTASSSKRKLNKSDSDARGPKLLLLWRVTCVLAGPACVHAQNYHQNRMITKHNQQYRTAAVSSAVGAVFTARVCAASNATWDSLKNDLIALCTLKPHSKRAKTQKAREHENKTDITEAWVNANAVEVWCR